MKLELPTKEQAISIGSTFLGGVIASLLFFSPANVTTAYENDTQEPTPTEEGTGLAEKKFEDNINSIKGLKSVEIPDCPEISTPGIHKDSHCIVTGKWAQIQRLNIDGVVTEASDPVYYGDTLTVGSKDKAKMRFGLVRIYVKW